MRLDRPSEETDDLQPGKRDLGDRCSKRAIAAAPVLLRPQKLGAAKGRFPPIRVGAYFPRARFLRLCEVFGTTTKKGAPTRAPTAIRGQSRCSGAPGKSVEIRSRAKRAIAIGRYSGELHFPENGDAAKVAFAPITVGLAWLREKGDLWETR